MKKKVSKKCVAMHVHVWNEIPEMWEMLFYVA